MISPENMVHIRENTIVHPINKEPLHGKEGPEKNIRPGRVVHYLKHPPKYGYEQGVCTHPIRFNLFLYFLCNGTHNF